MNPILFALRRPITVMVAIIAVVLTAFVAVRPKAFDVALAKVGIELPLKRMPIDIFPALNLPVIYVCQPYGGMDPAQMEGLLTNYYEYHFLYINGIHHVESRNVQGTALMKLIFHPGTNMRSASRSMRRRSKSKTFTRKCGTRTRLPGPCGSATLKPRSRDCWQCFVSWRSSCRASLCKEPLANCSSRCHWRSDSR